MGIIERFRKKERPVPVMDIAVEKNIVYQPVKGEIIPLEEIGDGVFSAGIMGQGCGLRPADEQVVSPVNGKITAVAETLHAVGIESDDGIELLIHVGLDTVSMNGKGFSVRVREGDRVKAGEPLLTFSKKEIAAAGFPDTTAVLVVNADHYETVQMLHMGMGEAGQKLIQVV